MTPARRARLDADRAVQLQKLTLARMVAGFVAWRREHTGDGPAFILPIECVVDCLNHVPSVAANDAARELVDLFCRIGRQVQPHGEPTIEMLRELLDVVGVTYVTCPADEFVRVVRKAVAQ